jgi:hypothetical protein
MISRENRVIAVFVALALGSAGLASQIPGLPSEVPLALLLGVGVIAPHLVTEYLLTE